MNNYTNHATDADTDETSMQTYSVVATMRVERYYSTPTSTTINTASTASKNGGATLTPSAISLLTEEKYINFFATCGPTFVRTLFRAQEMTAILSFHANNSTQANDFAEELRLYIFGQGKTANRAYDFVNLTDYDLLLDEPELTTTAQPSLSPSSAPSLSSSLETIDTNLTQSLEIEIIGFGLGLNKQGSQTLISTSLEELNSVMKFGFDSMIKNNVTSSTTHGGRNMGIVSAMEVVSWAEDAHFLQSASINLEGLAVPTPNVLIEDASLNTMNDQVCLESASEIDDYGKCCDPLELVNITLDDYQFKLTCRPLQPLSPMTMKDNLQVNAEFVTWLNSIVTEKQSRIADLGQCVNTLRAAPKYDEYLFLHPKTGSMYDTTMEETYSAKDLQVALNPNDNFSLLTMLKNEMDEFSEMFYYPCMHAIYGYISEDPANFNPTKFFAQPWYNIEQCHVPSCMDPNVAWDRVNGGGCIMGLLGRTTEPLILPLGSDRHCLKTVESVFGREVCKYTYPDDDSITTLMDECHSSLPRVIDARGDEVTPSIAQLMDAFCMPHTGGYFEHQTAANDAKVLESDDLWDNCVSSKCSMCSYSYSY
jgi:hypothetical protein